MIHLLSLSLMYLMYSVVLLSPRVSSVHWSTKYANDLQARGIAMCKSLSGLTKTQLELCQKHPEVTFLIYLPSTYLY